MKLPKTFIGYSNIKWLIKELIKVGSAKSDSFFSKKRIESGIAFNTGIFGMIYYLVNNHQRMTTTDIVMWSSILFTVAGYMIKHIQDEKIKTKQKEDIKE